MLLCCDPKCCVLRAVDFAQILPIAQTTGPAAPLKIRHAMPRPPKRSSPPSPALDAPPPRILPKPLQRLVIKIGSAVLAPHGQLDFAHLAALAAQMAAIRRGGTSITLVSSGAVASGFRELGLLTPPKTIVAKQSAAAIGQPKLMAAWAAAFAPHGLHTAQALFTGDDLGHRTRSLGARRVLDHLHSAGIIPIINENDTTSYEEIKLGDNDRLSALVADLCDAQLLLILSTARGLYEDGDPKRIIAHVPADGNTASKHVQPEKSAVGTGGMATKLSAAAVAARWGIPTIVAGGNDAHTITRVLAGELLGTFFAPAATSARARKRWIGDAAKVAGTIVVDAGAAKAITSRNASLLPSGIISVAGTFSRDAVVNIAVADGTQLGRGVVAYDSAQLDLVKGKKSADIPRILGFHLCDEAIHRSDLVLR